MSVIFLLTKTGRQIPPRIAAGVRNATRKFSEPFRGAAIAGMPGLRPSDIKLVNPNNLFAKAAKTPASASTPPAPAPAPDLHLAYVVKTLDNYRKNHPDNLKDKFLRSLPLIFAGVATPVLAWFTPNIGAYTFALLSVNAGLLLGVVPGLLITALAGYGAYRLARRPARARQAVADLHADLEYREAIARYKMRDWALTLFDKKQARDFLPIFAAYDYYAKYMEEGKKGTPDSLKFNLETLEKIIGSLPDGLVIKRLLLKLKEILPPKPVDAEAAEVVKTLTIGKITYTDVEPIGAGGMGEVFRAKDQNGKVVALKLAKPGQSPADLRKEADVMKRLRAAIDPAFQKHIANIINSGDTADGRPVIVMEFLAGLDLGKLIKDMRSKSQTFSAKAIARLFRQAATTLKEAKQVDFVHRDIKPGNAFVLMSESRGDVSAKDWTWVWTDWGTGLDVSAGDAEELQGLVGTPLYWGPKTVELAYGKLFDKQPLHDLSSEELTREDIASLGWTLLETTLGYPPLEGKANTLPELLKLMKSGKHLKAINRPDEVDKKLFEIALKMIKGKDYDNYAKLINDLNVYLGEGLEQTDSQGPVALPADELSLIDIKYLTRAPAEMLNIINRIIAEEVAIPSIERAREISAAIGPLYDALDANPAPTEQEEQLKQALINLATEIEAAPGGN